MNVLVPFTGSFWLHSVLANVPSWSQCRRYLLISASVRLTAFFGNNKYVVRLSVTKRRGLFSVNIMKSEIYLFKYAVNTSQKEHCISKNTI
jgi:hypothetical protein